MLKTPPAHHALPGSPVDPIAGEKSPATLGQRLGDYRALWFLAIAVFLLDRASKMAVVAHLPYGTYGGPGAIPVVDGFFYIVHVGNTGAAWSLFRGQSVFLALLAALTLGAVFIWRRSLGLRERIAQVSFGLLCGGIAGNLLDRIVYHHVVDFIDLHFGSYIYPTFNVADSGICVGVIIYLWHSLREQK